VGQRRRTLPGRGGFDQPFLRERPVGVLDRVRVDLELSRELPRRGQRVARFEDPDRNRPLNLIRDLPVDRPRVVCPQFHEH
jgi:hypothetical protein